MYEAEKTLVVQGPTLHAEEPPAPSSLPDAEQRAVLQGPAAGSKPFQTGFGLFAPRVG